MKPSITAGDRRSSLFTRIVYGVFALNLIALLLLLVGLFSGWFGLEAQKVADGTYHVGLVFDSDEAGDDIDATMEQASNMSKTVQSAASLETYDGTVESIDVEQELLELLSDGKLLAIHITDATEFDDGDLTSLAELNAGDSIRLTVQEKNDQLFAVNVAPKADETE